MAEGRPLREPALVAPLRRAAPAGPSQDPLPGARRSCRNRQLRQASDQLARQTEIGFGARALEVVDQRRETVARRLGQAHVARYDRVEDRRSEARTYVF